MPKYRVDATVTIQVRDLPIDLDCPPELGHTMEAAVASRLNDRMAILDLKGSRSGEDGTIDNIARFLVEIDNVNQE